MRRSSLKALAGILAAAIAARAAAQSRLVRVLAEPQGLPAPAVWALAQDDAGFLWFATPAGLYRFDGVELRRFESGVIGSPIFQLAAFPGGGVAARLENGDVDLIDGTGVRPLPGPGDRALRDVAGLCRGGDGELWLVRGGGLVRGRPGAWSEFAAPWRAGETPRRVQAAAGGVAVSSDRGLWRVRGGVATHLVDVPHLLGAVEAPDGGWWLLTADGRVLVWRSGEAIERFRLYSRAADIVRRGDWAWIALDRYLLAFDQEGNLQARLGPDEVPSGGPLVVDHEGSLWLGTFSGAFQFPEPETATLGEAQGLPSKHVRFLARDGDSVWASTWQGSERIVRGADGWAGSEPVATIGRICRDPAGGVWAGIPGLGIARHRAGGGWEARAPGSSLSGCAADPAGGLWLVSAGDLWWLAAGEETPRRLEGPPKPEGEFGAVLVDRRGRLWLEGDQRVCWTLAAPLAAAAAAAKWACYDTPAVDHLNDLAELPSGAIWGSSSRLGVVEIGERGARPLPGNGELTSRQLLGLVPAADGSVWILGHGVAQRVREDQGVPAGWRVEERITGWQGAPAGGSDLVEDGEGALWIATSRGVVRIPRAARPISPPPLRVALVEARSSRGPLPAGGRPSIPYADRTVRLRFAALSYREPALLRYQVRLAGRPWSEPASLASLEFPGLAPGSYAIEARASLDGVTWSEPPASFSFHILPPWYRTPWAMALAVAVAAALAWGAHRARVGVLLALERQRTRVAMDLHDEMGSGLGAIGILSGLLAQRSLDAEEQRQLAREIADTSQELGGALSDIVWALRSDGATLEALAGRLAESGGRLFAGATTAFACRFPEVWPGAPLSLPLRRNLLLTGLEALHNAARHARARRVELELLPGDGGWRLAVEDDGVGLPPDVEQAAKGMGLRSLRRRAEEIGGTVEWQRPPAGGTRLVLRFRIP